MGGNDPPAFFSLWIDRRKILSKFVWKPGYEAAPETPLLVGAVIGQSHLTLCHQVPSNEAITCTKQSLDLRKYPIDAEEYPAVPKRKPPVGTILVDPGSASAAFCQKYLDSTKRSPEMLENRMHYDSALSQTLEWDIKRQPDTDHSLGHLPGTFSNVHGRHVVVLSGGNHYFDGDILVLAPADVALPDIAAHFASEHFEQELAKPEPSGWTIISGGRQSLYPNASARYVHLVPQQVDGELVFLAYPTNRTVRPSGILLKPMPAGGFTSLCIFERVDAHF
jgi:hypothetical protein